jgi:hypothetical protein
MRRANLAYAVSSMTLRLNHDKATLVGALATVPTLFGDAAQYYKKSPGFGVIWRDAVVSPATPATGLADRT